MTNYDFTIPQWLKDETRRKRRDRKRAMRRYILTRLVFLLIVLVLVAVFCITITRVNNWVDAMIDDQNSFSGCVWDECPTYIQEKMLANHNGLYPPSHYERGTKEYMRSYCTYLPNKCRS